MFFSLVFIRRVTLDSRVRPNYHFIEENLTEKSIQNQIRIQKLRKYTSWNLIGSETHRYLIKGRV